MTPLKTNPTPVRDRSAQSAARRRSLEQIIEGVRRQRRHILMLDGVDPLRGGVAD